MFTFGKGVKTYPTKGSLDFTTVSVTRAETNVSLAQAFEAYFAEDTAVVPRSFIYRQGESAKDAKARGTGPARQLQGLLARRRAARRRLHGARGADDRLVGVDRIRQGKAAEGRRHPVRRRPRHVDRAGRRRGGRTRHGGRPGDDRLHPRRREEERRRSSLVRTPRTTSCRASGCCCARSSTSRSRSPTTSASRSAVRAPARCSPSPSTTGSRPARSPAGAKVAGTGEITPDGTVGPIGGIRQKIAGAADDGAKIFLVPAANCAEAVNGRRPRHAPGQGLDAHDAIDALEALGEEPQGVGAADAR